MQYKNKNLLTLDQIAIKKLFIRRSSNRKIMQVPVLTVHKEQKKKKEHDKLRRIILERLKDKGRFNRMLEIVDQSPNVTSTILRNRTTRRFYDSDRNTQLRKSLSYSYHKVKSAKILKPHQPQVNNRSFSDLTYKNQNSVVKNLIKKLSKTNIGANLTQIMQQRQYQIKQQQQSKIGGISFSTLGSSLSCKLVPYHKSNNLLKRRYKRDKINCQNQSFSSEKLEKYKNVFRSLQNRSGSQLREEELQGWQTNHHQKDSVEFHNCSLEAFQL